MSSIPEPIPFKAEGPQLLLREIPAGEPYPVDALGPLRGSVEAVQGQTLAPIAIPAQSALSVAALAVQAFADVETLGGPRPISLYCLTIAKSGERKSSCDAPLMAELRAFEREQAKERRGAMTSWQNAVALWKVSHEQILAGAKKGKGENRTAAQADLETLGAEPAVPPSTDRTVSEPTFEGLTRMFAEGQPSLGIFSDEGGQFLGGYAMSKDNRQKTLAALDDLWQGNPIRRTRAGDGAITLYGKRLAAHLMAQPRVAREFMADPMAGDIGFLPRFLICEPVSTIGTRMHALQRRDDSALAAFSQRMREILETPLPIDADTRELQPRLLPLSADARALLVQYSDSLEASQKPDGEFSDVTAYASKSAEQAARISGVLTLWGDLEAPNVGLNEMRDAITLAQFYLAEAARLVNAGAVSAKIEQAEKLRRWLLERFEYPEVMTRDVVQHAPIRSLRETPSARAALQMLESSGWLVPLDPGSLVRGAARREAWRIVRVPS